MLTQLVLDHMMAQAYGPSICWESIISKLNIDEPFGDRKAFIEDGIALDKWQNSSRLECGSSLLLNASHIFVDFKTINTKPEEGAGGGSAFINYPSAAVLLLAGPVYFEDNLELDLTRRKTDKRRLLFS